jgi:hypothetical protein
MRAAVLSHLPREILSAIIIIAAIALILSLEISC